MEEGSREGRVKQNRQGLSPRDDGDGAHGHREDKQRKTFGTGKPAPISRCGGGKV